MSQVITTLLLGDDPNSVRVAELANWKASTYVIPRNFLASIRDRAELNQPGIYFLFGEGADRPVVYIGQSEDCFGRLTDHYRQREIEQWNEAMVFTGGLHTTYVRYLECIAVREATRAKRYEVINRTAPTENKLTEAQKVTAEQFFLNMRFMTGFFGFRLFENIPTKESASDVYVFSQAGASAKGALLASGDFIVFKDSTARRNISLAFPISSKKKREELIEKGVLVDHNENLLMFAVDYTFGSPSGAANMVAGVACNGWDGWKDNEGKTLNENVIR